MAFDTTGTAPTSTDVFGWNDEIKDDGSYSDETLEVLPAGTYDFEVVKFDKEFQNPTAKIPNGCNKAKLTLKIRNADGKANLVFENLLLIKSLEWKLSAFFRSINLKKHGEALVMDWSKVKGAKGRCEVIVTEYTANDGTTKTRNEVSKFLDYDLPF